MSYDKEIQIMQGFKFEAIIINLPSLLLLTSEKPADSFCLTLCFN